jgi:hypothetical protein
VINRHLDEREAFDATAGSRVSSAAIVPPTRLRVVVRREDLAAVVLRREFR